MSSIKILQQTLHKKGRATSAPARVKARKLVPLNYEAVIAQALKSDKWLNSAMIKQLQVRPPQLAEFWITNEQKQPNILCVVISITNKIM